MFQNPPDPELRPLLVSARRIAVVGLSPDPDRPSFGVARRLQLAGYRVVPVNPSVAEVLGERSYPALDEVPRPVDVVDVFRRAEHAPDIAAAAVRAGARLLWLQDGVVSEEAAAIARAGGVTVVMDACLGVAVARLGIAVRP